MNKSLDSEAVAELFERDFAYLNRRLKALGYEQ